MNFPAQLFPADWNMVAWAVFLATLFVSIRRAPWERLKESRGSHVWLGAIVILAIMWSVKAGIKPGLTLHFIGAMAFVLSVGPYLALLGLTLVLAVVTANGDAGWGAFALNGLVMVVVPVVVAATVFHLVDRHMPNHFFNYILGAAFVGGALTAVATSLAGAALLLLAGIYRPAYLFVDYLPYYGMLAFAEGYLCGIVVTLLVIYRPEWVVTFDDARYLLNK